MKNPDVKNVTVALRRLIKRDKLIIDYLDSARKAGMSKSETIRRLCLIAIAAEQKEESE